MDNIFGYLLHQGKETQKRTLAYTGWFVDTFPKEEFEGDAKLFWHFCSFCVKLAVPLKYNYLETWLATDAKRIMLAESIKVPGCESLNYTDPLAIETAYRVTKEVMCDNYKVLEGMKLPNEDFPVAAASFMSIKKAERLTECLGQTFNQLNDTEDSSEAAEFALKHINLINEIYDLDNLEDLQDALSPEDRTLMTKVTDYGLPAIDNDCGGIYKKQLHGIEAQPGTGKTRLAVNVSYRAAVTYKQDICFISLEQDKIEIENMYVALHVYTLFKVIINDFLITRDKVPEELKAMVTAARLDLFESGKYGKIVIKNEVLYVESFIQKLKNVDSLLGPFDLFIIDYMGLLESNPGKFERVKEEAQIISIGYKLYKRYCRRYNKAGIAVGQLNRTGIAAGTADKDITAEMAQGGIAVYRNTDYNVAITMTPEMKAREQRRFQQPKVRSSAGFGTFIANTKLGICLFNQEVRKVV